MTLTELRYIIAVAHLRHFGRAAEACYVSQPTLSVAIRKLEQKLGVSLFERSPGDVRLTPIGERIVEQAEKVLAEADKITAIAKEGEDPLSVNLRVGAIYTIGPYLFPSLINTIQQLTPQMPLMLEENYTAVLSERLKRGEVDAAIVALPFDEPNITTLPLYDEKFVVAMPVSHPWTTQDEVSGEELHHERVFLLGAGHCFREQVLEAFPQLAENINHPMQQTLESSSLETIRQMVAGGAGVTILPCSATNRQHEAVCYRPLKSPAPRRRVAIAWRKSFSRPQAIECLQQAIQSCKIPCLEMLASAPTAE